MRVVLVSLFNGLGGARLASKDLDIVRCYTSEIDKYAMQVCDYNYPEDIEYKLGDVTKIDFFALKEEIREDFGEIDILLVGGSPCQNFSLAGKMKGSSTTCGIDVVTYEQYRDLKEQGFEFNGQSYLFWEYIRAKRVLNPTYFLLENVKITKKWLPMFNKAMGVEPIIINSALLSAQNRVRMYWHNFGGIQQPEDKGILLGDILDKTQDGNRECEKRDFNKNSLCHHIANASDIKGNESIRRVYAESGKSPTITTCQGGHREPKVIVHKSVKNTARNMRHTRGLNDKSFCCTASMYKGAGSNGMTLVPMENDKSLYRKLTPLECARLQTIPSDFELFFENEAGKQVVSNSQLYKMIGNGFTIDVIKYILNKGLR